MLIIPAEHKIDWRRPPFATLILIVINTLVFFHLQHQDQERWEQAYRYYTSNGLPSFEAPLYADYLQSITQLGLDSRTELAHQARQAVNNNQFVALTPYMLEDREFIAYLRRDGNNFIAPENFQNWQLHRAYIQTNYLDQLSYWKMGLVPAQIELPDLISYQFLHGNMDHLVGNMVMLFLVGFAVEIILGKALYLTAYLAAGAAGGLLFSLTEANSITPLVGASASIAGLMGMYVMYYRLQKIRFFYFVVVYFNYFKAPALLLLPFWLGKEIYEYYRHSASDIAYMAHVGGLLAGAAIMWPWANWSKPSEQPELSEEEQDQSFRELKNKALKAVSQVDFDKARQLFTSLHQQHPQDLDIPLRLFHLHKLKPDDPECQHYTQLTLDNALRQGNMEQAFEIWQEYQKYAGDVPLQDLSYHFRLLTGCFNNNRMKEAETVLDTLATVVKDPNLLHEAYTLAVQNFSAQQLQLKSRKYQKKLQALETSEPPPLAG